MSGNNNMSQRSNKSFLQSWKADSPEGWASRLDCATSDAHLKGWGASIIMWDFDGTADVSSLEALADGYDREQAHRPTCEVIALLAAIGYEDPGRRCVLREDARIDVKRTSKPTFAKIQSKRLHYHKFCPVEYAVRLPAAGTWGSVP